MTREDCQNCHVLSHASFNVCPYCDRPKGGGPSWTMELKDGVLRIDGEVVPNSGSATIMVTGEHDVVP